MSAALRLALFSLLLVIHSARPMSVAKRQSGQVTFCGFHTPCGWGVYNSNTRQMDYFVRNICQCNRPLERCLRAGDDVSISAYVYRCVRSRPSSSAVSSASVGSTAGRSSIDTAPNLIDMKL
ncbi:uncharacterized protein LOC130698448 [Daphnia carinata]|uniref:uncharacterized protein LOC130698448 n=1 Tax=Daphnia carinata TaxID=120202 RepID=UPI00257A4655|nr:uncharacterized protein LOC130698448 [Daphnia carinata]XP_059350389.1 uncharacterized protein LOC130698448 [Daphnia carinata]